ncbi:MAG: molecular chaperone HtpG [Kiritimatiellae bacterium]|nr:molecular chaperone HtpG [Kiritimatiellia bacterium]
MEKKNHLFKAEISQMLDLVVNSLYSKKEIFLRELLSNASDAIDRAKYLGLTQPELVADNPAWTIGIVVDRDAKTLTICDNGSGMDSDELENNLGVIASSGTKAFTQALKEKGDAANLPELIGRFGVGFYAAFMVADRVTVVSRKRGTDTAAEWSSEGTGSYTIGPAERAMPGTDVILHLREDQQGFLDEWTIRDLVKSYSDFIAYPIMFRELPEKTFEKEEDRKAAEERAAKPLNTMVALWKRAKKDVKPEEYAEFYRHTLHGYDDPLETIHFSGEGQVEFKSLLFLPKTAGMDLYMPQKKMGLSLYVRNVFIGNDFDMLLPQYLRFVKGVVDSSDLPLNVSREMLQDDVVIGKIKNAVTSKILSTLGEMKEKKADSYLEFWKVFGRILKEGVHTDYSNADRIKKLLLYPSAKTDSGKLISLDEYVKAMPKDQKDIYFLTAERIEDARCSPQIEQALKHGCDVLFFTDPVDEWLVDSFREYEGKKLVDVAKGDVLFGSEKEQKEEKEANEKAAADLKPFLDAVKEQLKDHVADVRVSTRLADSPCCLVAGANALSASMERMLRAMNQDVPHEKRTLEVNASHPLVQKMKDLTGDGLKDAVELLYDQALIAEGSPVPDPGRFSKLLTSLMLK